MYTVSPIFAEIVLERSRTSIYALQYNKIDYEYEYEKFYEEKIRDQLQTVIIGIRALMQPKKSDAFACTVLTAVGLNSLS